MIPPHTSLSFERIDRGSPFLFFYPFDKDRCLFSAVGRNRSSCFSSANPITYIGTSVKDFGGSKRNKISFTGFIFLVISIISILGFPSLKKTYSILYGSVVLCESSGADRWSSPLFLLLLHTIEFS